MLFALFFFGRTTFMVTLKVSRETLNYIYRFLSTLNGTVLRFNILIKTRTSSYIPRTHSFPKNISSSILYHFYYYYYYISLFASFIYVIVAMNVIEMSSRMHINIFSEIFLQIFFEKFSMCKCNSQKYYKVYKQDLRHSLRVIYYFSNNITKRWE